MKSSFWDRVLMFLYVLLTIVLCLCMALRPLGVDLIGDMLSGLESAAGEFAYMGIVFGLSAIIVLLSVYMLMMIFRRSGEREGKFITMNSGDGGRVRIALSALEQMARQAVGQIDGVKEMIVGITGGEDAIMVSVNLALETGAHVPSVTLNMQRVIRSQIERNCGVAVSSVEVTVNSLTEAETPPKPEHKLGFRRKADKVHAPEPLNKTESVQEEPAPAEPEGKETPPEIEETQDEAPLHLEDLKDESSIEISPLEEASLFGFSEDSIEAGSAEVFFGEEEKPEDIQGEDTQEEES